MGASVSESTGLPYGVERVCRCWDFPRSSFYARGGRAQPSPDADTVEWASHVTSVEVPGIRSERGNAKRRGPQPPVSEDELLSAIRADLESSPFQGEGHRKVFARLKLVRGMRVSRKRVLRLMRENSLLSPFRKPRGVTDSHDGTICTEQPNLMWGSDGMRVETVDDGWVWTFVAVDHFNSECVGHHVCKRGDRFAALEPIAAGLMRFYGSVDAGVARGLAVRTDHGTQYTSDHFIKQLRFWGIAPSFAFVSEPQTNGVAERFIRTLKEQAIHGRIFRNTEEVRLAVERFVADYNAAWRVEKLRFLTPREARLACGGAYHDTPAAKAA